MFATLNLQITALRTPLDGAIEPSGIPIDGRSAGQAGSLSFASLMAAQTDLQPAQMPVTGEILPEDGNDLPPVVPPKLADEPEPRPETEFSAAVTRRELDAPDTEMLALNVELAVPYSPARIPLIDPAQATLLPVGQMPAVVAGQPELTAKTVDAMPGAISLEAEPQADLRQRIAATLATQTQAASVPGAVPTEMAEGSEAPVVQPLAESLLRDKAPQAIPDAARPVVVPIDDSMIRRSEASAGERMPMPGVSVSALETFQRPDTRVAATSSVHNVTATHLPLTLSQFSIDAAQSRTELFTDTINTPVRDAAWGDKLGERVLMMSGNQIKTAEIKLTPADLGPLRIRISVEEGAAHVAFHAQHAVTREAIEQAMPRLREMLADSGLSLGQADVSDQGVADGKADREFHAGGRGGIGADGLDDPAESEHSERRKTVTSSKLLDTFA